MKKLFLTLILVSTTAFGVQYRRASRVGTFPSMDPLWVIQQSPVELTVKIVEPSDLTTNHQFTLYATTNVLQLGSAINTNIFGTVVTTQPFTVKFELSDSDMSMPAAKYIFEGRASLGGTSESIFYTELLVEPSLGPVPTYLGPYIGPPDTVYVVGQGWIPFGVAAGIPTLQQVLAAGGDKSLTGTTNLPIGVAFINALLNDSGIGNFNQINFVGSWTASLVNNILSLEETGSITNLIVNGSGNAVTDIELNGREIVATLGSIVGGGSGFDSLVYENVGGIVTSITASGSQLTAHRGMIGNFVGGNTGLVTSTAADAAKFLRGDGYWKDVPELENSNIVFRPKQRVSPSDPTYGINFITYPDNITPVTNKIYAVAGNIFIDGKTPIYYTFPSNDGMPTPFSSDIQYNIWIRNLPGYNAPEYGAIAYRNDGDISRASLQYAYLGSNPRWLMNTYDASGVLVSSTPIAVNQSENISTLSSYFILSSTYSAGRTNIIRSLSTNLPASNLASGDSWEIRANPDVNRTNIFIKIPGTNWARITMTMDW